LYSCTGPAVRTWITGYGTAVEIMMNWTKDHWLLEDSRIRDPQLDTQ
jgi:hypothetical protein